MLVCVDFDDTVVSQDGRAYDDVTTPLRFVPGAAYALAALKRAGHTLILFSGRANRALRVDPMLNPLVRAGVVQVDKARWAKSQVVNEARYQQMLAFVERELPGVFDAVDDGQQGKPSADLYIDDKALRVGYGVAAIRWSQIASIYGEPVYGFDDSGARDAEVFGTAEGDVSGSVQNRGDDENHHG